MALALDLTGLQKILYQLEYGDDVAAVLGMLFIWRQKLCQPSMPGRAERSEFDSSHSNEKFVSMRLYAARYAKRVMQK